MKENIFKRFRFSKELNENKSICRIQTLVNDKKKILEATFIKEREHGGGLDKHLYIFKEKSTYRTFVCYLFQIKEIQVV